MMWISLLSVVLTISFLLPAPPQDPRNRVSVLCSPSHLAYAKLQPSPAVPCSPPERAITGRVARKPATVSMRHSRVLVRLDVRQDVVCAPRTISCSKRSRRCLNACAQSYLQPSSKNLSLQSHWATVDFQFSGLDRPKVRQKHSKFCTSNSDQVRSCNQEDRYCSVNFASALSNNQDGPITISFYIVIHTTWLIKVVRMIIFWNIYFIRIYFFFMFGLSQI